MSSGDIILVIVVGTAVVFDFTNGFHDTANVVATAISTRAIGPGRAVAMASVLNFVGAFISLKVASTIGQGFVDSGAVTTTVVFAALVGAIALEPHHLVLRAAVELVARAHRRAGRRGDRGPGLERGQRRGLVDKLIVPGDRGAAHRLRSSPACRS